MAVKRAERDVPDPAVECAWEQELLALDDTPDGPAPFGYETSWAVKCGSPDEEDVLNIAAGVLTLL